MPNELTLEERIELLVEEFYKNGHFLSPSLERDNVLGAMPHEILTELADVVIKPTVDFDELYDVRERVKVVYDDTLRDLIREGVE